MEASKELLVEVETELEALRTQLRSLPSASVCGTHQVEIDEIRQTLHEAIALRTETQLEVRKAIVLRQLDQASEHKVSASKSPPLFEGTIRTDTALSTATQGLDRKLHGEPKEEEEDDDNACPQASFRSRQMELEEEEEEEEEYEETVQWLDNTTLCVFPARGLDGSIAKRYGRVRQTLHEWKHLIDCGVDNIGCLEEDGREAVLLVYGDPRTYAEVPCKYHPLDCDYQWRCKFHHGLLIYKDDIEPAITSLNVPCKVICKASPSNPLWTSGVAFYKPSVTSVDVQIDGVVNTLPATQVLPDLQSEHSASNRVEGYVYDSEEEEDDERDESLNLIRDPQRKRQLQEMWRELEESGNTDSDFGKWMTHTSGIGLKLLKRYGYKPGRPLQDKHESTLVAPIQLIGYPPGRSLDFLEEYRQQQRQSSSTGIPKGKKAQVKNKRQNTDTGPKDRGLFKLLNNSRVALFNNATKETAAAKAVSAAEGKHQSDLSTLRKAKTSEADLRKKILLCEEKIRQTSEQVRKTGENQKRHKGVEGVSSLYQAYSSELSSKETELRRLQEELRVLNEKVKGVRTYKKLNVF